MLFFLSITAYFSNQRHLLSSRLRPLLIIGLFVVGFHAVFNSSAVFLERIIIGAAFAIRIVVLSMVVFLFTATISTKELIDMFSFLPKKAQLVLTIMFSFIPITVKEGRKIILVQNSRGHNSKGIHIIRSALPFVIPLIHRVLVRAEQISLVLESRGYSDR